MTTIRAVLFDLDDTLFAHRESVNVGIVAHAATLGDAFAQFDAAAEMRRWDELEERHYHRYLAGELDYLAQRTARAREFVAPYGQTLGDAESLAWFDDYLVQNRLAWRLHDDAAACLDALAGRVRVGMITNGDLGFQLSKLEALGLTGRFEPLVASGALGITKPDARIFRHAVEQLGIAAHEAMYVGDRLRTDAIGAAEAGLTGVWLNRHGVELTAEERADATAAGVVEITSLSEVPGLLG